MLNALDLKLDTSHSFNLGLFSGVGGYGIVSGRVGGSVLGTHLQSSSSAGFAEFAKALLGNGAGKAGCKMPKSLRAISDKKSPDEFFDICIICFVCFPFISILANIAPTPSSGVLVMPTTLCLVGTSIFWGILIPKAWHMSRPAVVVWQPVSVTAVTSAWHFPLLMNPYFAWMSLRTVTLTVAVGEGVGMALSNRSVSQLNSLWGSPKVTFFFDGGMGDAENPELGWRMFGSLWAPRHSNQNKCLSRCHCVCLMNGCTLHHLYL